MKPVAAWKAFIGGNVARPSLAAVDVDGDQLSELVYVVGGRATARRANGDVIWQTELLGISAFLGVDDVNGDGTLDVFVRSSDHAYVLSARTGAVEWREPEGEMGTLRDRRFGDLNGDGKNELVLIECGCCGVHSGIPGAVWSFGEGFAAARRLWTLPVMSCGPESPTIADLDGDGTLEMVINDYNYSRVLRGSDGIVLASTPALGSSMQSSECRSSNVDGVPGDEILCIQDVVDDAANVGQRRVMLLHYNGATGVYARVWNRALAPSAGGSIWYANPLVDLDGDGHQEVVVSGRDAAGEWTTYILDAASGAERLHLSAMRVQGTAPIGVAGRQVLLTTPNELDTQAFTYTANPQPTTQAVWALPGRVVMLEEDAILKKSGFAERPMVFDLNNDGVGDLVTRAADGPSLEVRSGGAAPLSLGRIPLTAGFIYPSVWLLPPVSGTQKQLAVSRTDGILSVFDRALQPIYAPSEAEPGFKAGGYYSSGYWRDLQTPPITCHLDRAGIDRAVLMDGRGALVALDASSAGMASPPTTMWTVPDTLAPASVELAEGASGVVAVGLTRTGVDFRYSVKKLRADGTIVWNMADDMTVLGDLVPANIDGDAITDLVYDRGASGETLLHTRALAGSSGAVLWNAVPLEPGAGRQPAGFSVADWNADGTDDVVMQAGTTRILDGKNGSLMTASEQPDDSYSLPTLFDVNTDGVDEVVLHGRYSPPKMLSHDLRNTLWVGTEDDRPYPYGAIASCPGAGPILAEGSYIHPASLKMTPLAGPQLGVARSVVLASGQLFATEAAAVAAGYRLRQLSSTSVHANITGRGHPSALVGSGDGWLYAVNPCTAELDFAYDFKAPVGSIVFGDTDGNGRDEVLVAVGDGHLYALRNEAEPSPEFAWDTDVRTGVEDSDVAEVVTRDTLSARWATVPSATSYEVAVVNATGQFVSEPRWRSVGLVDRTSVTGLELQHGKRYVFAVRAIGSGGTSVDAVTNGVLVKYPQYLPPPRGPLSRAAEVDQEVGVKTDSAGCALSAAARARGEHATLLTLAFAFVVSGQRRRARFGRRLSRNSETNAGSRRSRGARCDGTVCRPCEEALHRGGAVVEDALEGAPHEQRPRGHA